MRKPSVADALAADDRRREQLESPAARVARALVLGRQALALRAAVTGFAPAAARREVERGRQARRRTSRALDALLA